MGDEGAHSAVIRSGSYSYRAPSPPKIVVPVQGSADVRLDPAYDYIDHRGLSRAEYAIITGNRMQLSADRSSRWRYEQRRDAQRILDYLYLGPTSTIRDHDFLQSEAFTMLVVVRDSRAVVHLASVDNANKALNIPFCYIDADPSHLVKSFDTVVDVINAHLLSVHHMSAGTKRGRVLVTCNTGNMISPSLVAAYIMAMFARDLMAAIHFISVQRFCVNFDEEAKRSLLTWCGLIQARIAVADQSDDENGHAYNHAQATMAEGKANSKRGLDDMMEGIDENVMTGSDAVTDHERFLGRENYAPFLDVEY
ncbi:hypothetical protein V8C35DRAFT_315844 [Trichoderma chlorosporum]